jgi:hypothetical protein
MMMKRRGSVLLVTVAAFAGLAAGQNSNSNFYKNPPYHPSSSASQPLTPKSDIPKTTKGRKTNTELARLEQQNVKAGGSKSGNTGAAKSTSIKSAGTTSRSGSGINASYQKPHVPKR